ncbi:hypothetical protein [Amorphus sp. 3PC139-8]|uniref:hypothetical protein n=1 Tax=Amorphus sp. 3PC139-8 TaxID=2735676 RepID=UPI00345DDCBE
MVSRTRKDEDETVALGPVAGGAMAVGAMALGALVLGRRALRSARDRRRGLLPHPSSADQVDEGAADEVPAERGSEPRGD